MEPKTAIAIASAAISAVGAIQQGNAANSAAKFEADQLRQQAERDRAIAAQDADDFADNESRNRARFRALLAGSGATLEGTPLAVLSDLAGEAEFQRRRIMAAGETAANRAEGQAALRRFEGRNAQRAGFTRAGATLLTAASEYRPKLKNDNVTTFSVNPTPVS